VSDATHDNLIDGDCPPELSKLGRTQCRWRTQISNWQHVRVTNAANLIKRVVFGFRRFNH